MKQDTQDTLNIIKELRADLFYQIESKFGPEKASKYPSIVKADEHILELSKEVTKNRNRF